MAMRREEGFRTAVWVLAVLWVVVSAALIVGSTLWKGAHPVELPGTDLRRVGAHLVLTFGVLLLAAPLAIGVVAAAGGLHRVARTYFVLATLAALPATLIVEDNLRILNG
ncbi:hypothetical protein [Dactylosporangium sp. CA-233914]|uniref:hypothetical protein n=1 Tax=Dactylosporangium sp. CA-233914 TaxID=3239934 RepID=UPI003D8BB777